MTQVRPDLLPYDRIDGEPLAMIAFGMDVPALLSIDAPQLGETLVEVWAAAGAIARGVTQGIAYAACDDVMLVSLSCDDADPRRAAACVYDRLIAFARSAGYPHLLRVWNHISDINAVENDLERYRAFCEGRHDSFVRHGYAMRGDLPAASGVGMQGRGVATYCVAVKTPPVAIENPRQVSAYDYPARYGPRSPSFSRATILDELVFVSGTASIVGHETRHAGDVVLQLSETLMNLEVVLAAAHARELAIAKVYLRRAQDYRAVAAHLAKTWRRTKVMYLRADLCRADLLVEIEGIAVIGR